MENWIMGLNFSICDLCQMNFFGSWCDAEFALLLNPNTIYHFHSM